jgi:hypothetical protein
MENTVKKFTGSIYSMMPINRYSMMPQTDVTKMFNLCGKTGTIQVGNIEHARRLKPIF